MRARQRGPARSRMGWRALSKVGSPRPPTPGPRTWPNFCVSEHANVVTPASASSLPDTPWIAGGGTRKRAGSFRSPSYCIMPTKRVCAAQGAPSRAAFPSESRASQVPDFAALCAHSLPPDPGIPQARNAFRRLTLCASALQHQRPTAPKHGVQQTSAAVRFDACMQDEVHREVCQQCRWARLREALAVEGCKVLVLEGLADLDHAVGAEVEDGDRVAVLLGTRVTVLQWSATC